VGIRGAFSAVLLTAAAKPSLHVRQGALQLFDLYLDLLEPAAVVIANPATGLVGSAAASALRGKLIREFADRDRPFVVPELAPQSGRHLQQLDLIADARGVVADHRRFFVATYMGIHLERVYRAFQQIGRIAAVGFEQRRQGETHDLDAIDDVVVRPVSIGTTLALAAIPAHLPPDLVGDALEHVQFTLATELLQCNHPALQAVENLLQVRSPVRPVGVRMAPGRRADKDADSNGRSRPRSLRIHDGSSSVHQ